MKITLSVLLLSILFLSVVSASGDHAEIFEHAEELIEQKIPCEELTLDQLEIIGEYFMEQMHPGELHEIMDERMGGEGSESLRQAHINMGRAFYCGEHGAMSGGMMNTMMGRNGMMDLDGSRTDYQGFRSVGVVYGFLWVICILFVVAIILLIVWLNKRPSAEPRRSKRRGRKK